MSESRPLRVVSYNLKYASEKGPHPWSGRRAAMIELLDDLAPDVLGTQEGLADQLDDLAAGLGPDYAFVGEGRRGGRSDEFCAVFHRRSRVTVRAVANRWLSDTPEVAGSRGWGNELPRMFTDVRCTDLESGRDFRVVNTHLDHVSEPAQRRSGELLATLLAEEREPTLLLGDFNLAAEATEPYRRLRATPLEDALLAAEQPEPTLGSFGDWARPAPDGPRIDWILLSPGLPVRRGGVVDRQVDGRYPSDHLPVFADVVVDNQAPGR